MHTRKKRVIATHPFHPMVRPTRLAAVVGYPLVDEPTLFVVHRLQRRTIPCQGTDCPFCFAMMVTEERIYMPMMDDSRQEIVIVDLPASHIESLNALAERFHSLRNLKLLMERRHPADNAPIVIRERELKGDEKPLASFDHLIAVLDHFFARNVEFALAVVTSQKWQAEDRPDSTIARRRDV